MKRFQPAPKCPEHRVFMKFRVGSFPHRTYFCPCCRDHWRERGLDDGEVDLVRAFRSAEPSAPPTTSLVPVAQEVVRTERVYEPYPVPEYRAVPTVHPVVTGLAIVGGIAILGAILSSGRRSR
jgi:hypothetical protein